MPESTPTCGSGRRRRRALAVRWQSHSEGDSQSQPDGDRNAISPSDGSHLARAAERHVDGAKVINGPRGREDEHASGGVLDLAILLARRRELRARLAQRRITRVQLAIGLPSREANQRHFKRRGGEGAASGGAKRQFGVVRGAWFRVCSLTFSSASRASLSSVSTSRSSAVASHCSVASASKSGSRSISRSLAITLVSVSTATPPLAAAAHTSARPRRARSEGLTMAAVHACSGGPRERAGCAGNRGGRGRVWRRPR